jgi:hypothetical protein
MLHGLRKTNRGLVLIAIVGLASTGCTTAMLSLLAPVPTQNPRNPDPFRPLVEPPATLQQRDRSASRPSVARSAAEASFAALIAWFAGKGPLFFGVSGTFDESEWFGRRKPKPRRPRPAP